MNENGFLLSTIHKCKGLEWPHVAILDPWLMPSKFAEQEWEKQQEHNLSYVAITRAQQTLHYVNSDSIT
jgi:superfamily I DNA/RNA helicase